MLKSVVKSISHPVLAAKALLGPSSVFSHFYQKQAWNSGESVSGTGSEEKATIEIRAGLRGLVDSLGVQSLLDAPCGDFNWMSKVDLASVQYHGVEIVPELLAKVKAQHEQPPQRRFYCMNICEDSLPKADLILCRDCLVHLSYRNIRKALANFQRFGARYLLTTTFPGQPSNFDILTGLWRPLNLEAKPFSFPKPIRLMPDVDPTGPFSDKSLGLWNLAELSF